MAIHTVRAERKVLACVDQSRYADYVADYASWAALRLGAPLELLHALDRHPEVASSSDHSGTIGFDAQDNLLTELSGQDEIRSRAAREQGRLFLNRLRERAIRNGVSSPDVRQRNGALDETLVEQEPGVRLFVLGRRGTSAESTQRDLGRNVEHVMRSLSRPILTVTEDFQTPRRAMIAFDGGMHTRRAVRIVAASPLFKGLPVHVLMSGKPKADAQKQLEWANASLQEAGFETVSALVPGDTESIIARTIVDQSIDILIMGGYAHSAWRALLFGSKTSDLLRSARIPTLIVR